MCSNSKTKGRRIPYDGSTRKESSQATYHHLVEQLVEQDKVLANALLGHNSTIVLENLGASADELHDKRGRHVELGGAHKVQATLFDVQVVNALNVLSTTTPFRSKRSDLSAYPHTDTQTHRHTDTDTQIQTHTHTHTHRQTDTQTHRHINALTRTHTHIHPHPLQRTGASADVQRQEGRLVAFRPRI
jgi:hypothetical protein